MDIFQLVFRCVCVRRKGSYNVSGYSLTILLINEGCVYLKPYSCVCVRAHTRVCRKGKVSLCHHSGDGTHSDVSASDA